MPRKKLSLDDSPELIAIRREIESLQDREKAELERVKLRYQLLDWLRKRPLLTARDVVTVAQKLKPKRGKTPVSTEVTIGFKPRRVAPRTPLGIAMVEARKRRNLSVEQAASLIQAATSSVHAWEGGHVEPGPEALARMVKELGVVLPARPPSPGAAKRDIAKPKAAKRKAAPKKGAVRLNGSGKAAIANGAAAG
ncbi:MAG TPA: helix-turn-helix transcriptional regulator [Reyranella sp.]|nr:helix-turn-helix transcriptional regulator [Reyranella sp.]